MSVGAAIAIGAVVGLALGIVVSVTTEIPLAPEAGLVLGAAVGWLSRPRPRAGTNLLDTERAMSRENVEIVRRIYAALDLSEVSRFGGPPESIHGLIDPEIEWQGPREFPDLAETVHGYAGIARYGAKIAEAFDDYRMAPERFIDAGGDRVLVFSREGGRGKGSGAEVQTHLTAHLWTLRDGRAVRMQSYWERADALEAAGLLEQDAQAEGA